MVRKKARTATVIPAFFRKRSESLLFIFGMFGIAFPPKVGDFYYIIENFGRVCEIFGFMALEVCTFCVQD